MFLPLYRFILKKLLSNNKHINITFNNKHNKHHIYTYNNITIIHITFNIVIFIKCDVNKDHIFWE